MTHIDMSLAGLKVHGVQCSRPNSWGTRTGTHRYGIDGVREYCPTCDYREIPLALAIVASRPWWCRLLNALPWRRRALEPDPVATYHAQLREYDAELEEWERGGPRAGEPPWARPVPPPRPPTASDDELYRVVEYRRAMAIWRANPDGRPAPTMIPSAGVSCSR